MPLLRARAAAARCRPVVRLS